MTTNEVFLNCIAAFLQGETISLELSREGWLELLEKAEEQKLLPMIFEAAGASMPEGLRGSLKKRVKALVIGQTLRTAEFKKTYAQLAEAGIYPLVVKGIVCRAVYAKPDMRASSDEDLYVAENYGAFRAKMLELGFNGKEPDYENSHEERFTRNGLLIEGHWELFPKDNSALNALNGLAEGFWQRVEMQSVDGVSLLCLEPTDHMIFLLLHAYKHFINSGVGIRQICDIALWAKTYELDWQRIYDAMESAKALCFASAIFDAAEKYFGMSFPENWERADSTALINDALDGGIYGSSDMNRKHSASMTLEAVDAAGARKVGKPLIKTLFPSRAVMETSYPWVKKSALLLPAAWSARIAKYVFGEKNSSAAESVKIGRERLELLKEYKIIP